VRRHTLISSPARVFLLLGIVYGIFFLFVTPPFQVPDEPNHFYRAYQISEGRFIAAKKFPPTLTTDQIAERNKEIIEIQNALVKGDTETVQRVMQSLKGFGGIGGFLPESLATTTKAFLRLLNPANRQIFCDLLPFLRLPLNEKDRTFIHFPNTALYSPVPYLPQAVGIALGRILHSSPLALMYMGRVLNLAVWILLIYLAITITPICKWLFCLLALMPMSLFQGASLSADSFTYGISFLLIAVFLRNSLESPEVLRINVYAMVVLSLLLSLSKQAYFLIPLLFLLIPVKKIGTKKKYYAIFSLICLLDVGAILLWTHVADIHSDIYTLYNSIIPALSAEKQTLFILSHPLEYIRILMTSLIRNWKLYADSFVGQLGWFDTALPESLRVSYIAMLFFTALSENLENIVISLKQRIIIVAVLILSIVLVSTLAFIGWTPVGTKNINIQGRYFIPLAPLFFLLFYNRKISLNLNGGGARLVLVSYSMFSLTYTAYVIIRRYYIG
jgi:uncharacterized membrane protein